MGFYPLIADIVVSKHLSGNIKGRLKHVADM